MGSPGCPLVPPKGLGVHAPKQEKVHIASKWDSILLLSMIPDQVASKGPGVSNRSGGVEFHYPYSTKER
jgi:hypothetical protein